MRRRRCRHGPPPPAAASFAGGGQMSNARTAKCPTARRRPAPPASADRDGGARDDLDLVRACWAERIAPSDGKRSSGSRPSGPPSPTSSRQVSHGACRSRPCGAGPTARCPGRRAGRAACRGSEPDQRLDARERAEAVDRAGQELGLLRLPHRVLVGARHRVRLPAELRQPDREVLARPDALDVGDQAVEVPDRDRRVDGAARRAVVQAQRRARRVRVEAQGVEAGAERGDLLRKRIGLTPRVDFARYRPPEITTGSKPCSSPTAWISSYASFSSVVKIEGESGWPDASFCGRSAP